jgi:hypothetical protein
MENGSITARVANDSFGANYQLVKAEATLPRKLFFARDVKY